MIALERGVLAALESQAVRYDPEARAAEVGHRVRHGSVGWVNARKGNGHPIITGHIPERVAVDLPAEPPIGSVVIDRDGMA